MYYIYGQSGPSLLIESTDSMMSCILCCFFSPINKSFSEFTLYYIIHDIVVFIILHNMHNFIRKRESTSDASSILHEEAYLHNPALSGFKILQVCSSTFC